MQNTFIANLQDFANLDLTQNGALAHKSTRSKVYDLFALGGAYRRRGLPDQIMLFKQAFEENEELALKCLFYLRDCRGGQGERQFFRNCFKWLCFEHPVVALRNLEYLSEYGRWDDLIYTTFDTPLFDDAFLIIQHQLYLDLECKTPSLLAKWMPSENASSTTTKTLAHYIRAHLGLTHKQYRQMLSKLRERINIVERLMSANRWDEIEFDKIPSKAGLIYKNAFARRDIIAKKYEAFAKSAETKVNAKTLFPYDVVSKAVGKSWGWGGNYRFPELSEVDRAMIEKYWDNLPDYLNGKPCKIMCVVDTSGSMTCSGKADAPINVAISLGMYCAERIGGPFKNHYISFSNRPQFIEIKGVDFVDKVRRIYQTNLCQNTNIEATFNLLMNAAKTANPEDIPETIIIISDMQIDSMNTAFWSANQTVTEMERIRKRWENNGLKMPHLVYWNVNASKNTILDGSSDVTYVSGCSPVIFEQVLTGVTGYELMLKKLMSERYAVIK